MKAMIAGAAERRILLGVPVLFFAGTLFHFGFRLSGELFFVGLLAPVNESVWEHFKLLLWPVILWWTLGYLFHPHQREIDAPAWFYAAFIALCTGCGVIALLFYFYTGAFGVESVVIDILIFLLAVVLGQMAGVRVYQRGSGLSWPVPLVLLIALAVLFAVFTLAPPPLPLFTDPNTGLRGIFQIGYKTKTRSAAG